MVHIKIFKRIVVLITGVVVVACSSALTLKAAIGVGHKLVVRLLD